MTQIVLELTHGAVVETRSIWLELDGISIAGVF